MEVTDESSRPTGSTRFEELILPEVEVALRVARSLTRDPVEAEDLVQDTLVRAFRGIDRFDGRYPRAWLLTILRNTHINRNRRRRPGLLTDPDTVSDVVDQATAVDEVVTDAVAFDEGLAAALADLPDAFRRVIELVDVEGRSYAEAAQALDVPVGTIMSRVHRGRRRLRDHLTANDLAPRSRA